MNRTDPGTHEPNRRFPRAALALAGIVLILFGVEIAFKGGPVEARKTAPPPSPGWNRSRRDSRGSYWKALERAKEARARAEAKAQAMVEAEPPPEPVAPPEPVEPAPSDRAIVLTAIAYDAGDPDARFAVIGGRAYREGEHVGRWLVGAVERDRVVLEGEGRLELSLR